ncbi:MAG: HlyC/CorC family transporter [Acidobacteria bacterium]|nr:HlyC/CorC family transporter [Acidobacteriota bacterium]
MEHSLTGILWRVAILLALVIANGFFVAAEFSIVTVRKTRVDQLIAEGQMGARAVRRAVSDPDRYIAATQLGITMASLGLGWVGEPMLASIIEPLFSMLPVAAARASAHSVAVAVAFALVTALHIVLGELAPKTIALEKPERTALVVVRPTELFMRTFAPFIRLLNGAGRAVVELLGLHSRGGHAMVHSEEELMMLVTASQEAGVLEEGEEQMLHRVFGFADLTAGHIMTPRTELAAIAVGTPREAIVEQVASARHTRLPVYEKDLDNVIGILHVTDLVKALARPDAAIDPAALARETLTVPETLNASDLLAEMRRRRVREALVIDEYGGTAGMVTFESLMDRIGGEFGGADVRIAVRPDGSADIDGLALITDVNTRFGLHIDEDEYSTFGGYVLGRLGRRPRVGDTCEVEGRALRVDALDGLRVARVWLSKPDDRPAGGQARPS